MNVYRVGYQVNDVYAVHLKMGSPSTLDPSQTRVLVHYSDGRPISTTRSRIRAGEVFVRDVPMRENDVYLITLER